MKLITVTDGKMTSVDTENEDIVKILKDELGINPYVPFFVFAGESNAAGVLPRDFLTLEEKNANTALKFWNEQASEFENAIIGINTIAYNTLNSFGLELELGNLAKNNAFNSKMVFACKIAYSGAIVEHLLGQFETHKNTLDKCLTEIKNLGFVPLPIVVYSQGINNGGNNLDPEIWKDYTFEYFDKIRSVLGYAPIFITRLIHVGSMYNNMIDTFPSFDSNINIIETSDLSLYEPNHWNKQGLAGIINRVVNRLFLKYGENAEFLKSLSTILENNYVKNYSAKKVGLGKSNPAEMLDIGGNAIVDGFLKTLGGLITTQSIQADGDDCYFGGAVVKNNRNESRGTGLYLSRNYIGKDIRSDGTNYTSESDGNSNEGVLIKTSKQSVKLYHIPKQGDGTSFQNVLANALEQYKTIDFARTSTSIYNTLNLYNRLVLWHESGYQGINHQYKYTPTGKNDENPVRGDFWLDDNYIYFKVSNEEIKRVSINSFNKALSLRNEENTGDIFEIYNNEDGTNSVEFGASTRYNFRTGGITRMQLRENGHWILQESGNFNDVECAISQVNSSNKGILIPRLTTVQINAIQNPVIGLIVFNTDLGVQCHYNGGQWRKVVDEVM